MATPDEIAAAARLLEAGGLVAFPTETVYGLGADAENPAAVAGIYALKGRPSKHPVIVHLAPEADIGYWVTALPPEAQRLIDVFWPGPLTLILKRAAYIPDAVSGGQDTIGLRCPSHPLAQDLLREFKHGRGGLAAPSANRFGHVSPTTAQHVRDEFGSALPCVLDGGPSDVGIESTIIDLSRAQPALLRPGQIGAQRIADVLGVWPQAPDAAAPRVSGALDSHYAPRTPVALLDTSRIADVVARLAAHGKRAALIHYTACADSSLFAQCVMPADADGYAQSLYAALRAMDAEGADFILLEAPPESGEWQGINDRLRRAAHDTSGMLNGLVTR